MTLHAPSGCDRACALCRATGQAASADAPAAARLGGGRLTLRGDAAGARAMLVASAEASWSERVVHTHGNWRAEDLVDAGASGVRVPLFSHVAAVHDRIVGSPGQLEQSLEALERFASAGLRVEIEVPLLARRLSHPLSVVQRARASCDRVVAARFVAPRGEVHAQLVTPPWTESGPLLEEALAWCAEAGIEAALNRDAGVPFCALPERGEVFRFDPKREREPAFGCVRPPVCVGCACAAQCPGVPRRQVEAHGEVGLRPFPERPSALYHQRSTPHEEWTEERREAAKRTGLLVLRPTVNCNQDCVFCSANETSANVWTSDDAMLKQIVRAAERGVSRLAFGGGEPTLAKGLPRYVAEARRLGIAEVELVTNGTLLDREAKVRALADAGLTHAFVSLHAHDERLSRHLTRKEGDFDRTVKATGLLADAGVKTTVNHVITTENMRFLSSFVRFVRGRFEGRVAISFAFVTPQYKALEDLAMMPRMSALQPHLEAAMSEALALDQPAWIGARQGIPPCRLGAFRAWSDIFEHAAAGIAEDTPQKTRAPGCDRCRYTRVCTGVWRPYAERHGTDELTPIEGAPFGEDELAAIRAIKREPWGLPPSDFEALPSFLRDREAEARDAAADTGTRALPTRPIARGTRPVRVALFGDGRRAAELAAALRQVESATLDAVVGPHAEEVVDPAFGDCPRWTDATEALDAIRPDAVVVAGRSAPLAALARDRGVPTLAPAHPLLLGYGLDDIEGPLLRVVHRVGPRAPAAWSRRGLAPLLEDVLALVLWRHPGAALEDARFVGASRPERVQLQLRCEQRRIDVTLELDGGAPRLDLAADRGDATATLDAADARMLESFVRIVREGGSLPDASLPDVAGAASALSAEVIDRLAAAGLPFARANAPKHVASPSFREPR